MESHPFWLSKKSMAISPKSEVPITYEAFVRPKNSENIPRKYGLVRYGTPFFRLLTFSMDWFCWENLNISYPEKPSIFPWNIGVFLSNFPTKPIHWPNKPQPCPSHLASWHGMASPGAALRTWGTARKKPGGNILQIICSIQSWWYVCVYVYVYVYMCIYTVHIIMCVWCRLWYTLLHYNEEYV